MSPFPDHGCLVVLILPILQILDPIHCAITLSLVTVPLMSLVSSGAFASRPLLGLARKLWLWPSALSPRSWPQPCLRISAFKRTGCKFQLSVYRHYTLCGSSPTSILQTEFSFERSRSKYPHIL